MEQKWVRFVYLPYVAGLSCYVQNISYSINIKNFIYSINSNYNHYQSILLFNGFEMMK